MNDIESAIKYARDTQRLEDVELTEEEIETIRKLLLGEITLEEVIENIINDDKEGEEK